MWIDSKKLLAQLKVFLADTEREGTFERFHAALRPQFERLKFLLQNHPKSPGNRLIIKKINENAQLPGGTSVKLDQQLSEDSIAISDLFNLDELDALELVLAAEIQQQRYRSLSTLKCAILCYYETHRNFLELLNAMLAYCPNGMLNNGTSNVMNIINELLSSKTFFYNLIDQFNAFTIEGELKKLVCGNFGEFGTTYHQEMLLQLLREIIMACYNVICLTALYSPQPIQKDILKRLFSMASSLVPESNTLSIHEITSLTALLLFINPARLQQQCDGSTDLFTEFSKEIFNAKWAHPCMKATVQLCFGVSIKYARNSLGLAIPYELDEYEFIEQGLSGMAIEFIQNFVVKSQDFGSLSFSVDVFDSLLKNFICYFGEKTTEMYNICEEELFRLIELQQQEQLLHKSHNSSGNGRVPSIKYEINHEHLHFKALLELIAALYESDNPKLIHSSRDFTNPKCEALSNFIKSCRAISAPPLAISYLNMLRSLCKTKQSSNTFFNLLK